MDVGHLRGLGFARIHDDQCHPGFLSLPDPLARVGHRHGRRAVRQGGVDANEHDDVGVERRILASEVLAHPAGRNPLGGLV